MPSANPFRRRKHHQSQNSHFDDESSQSSLEINTRTTIRSVLQKVYICHFLIRYRHVLLVGYIISKKS